MYNKAAVSHEVTSVALNEEYCIVIGCSSHIVVIGCSSHIVVIERVNLDIVIIFKDTVLF